MVRALTFNKELLHDHVVDHSRVPCMPSKWGVFHANEKEVLDASERTAPPRVQSPDHAHGARVPRTRNSATGGWVGVGG